jgi:hypothetical protein
MSLSSQTVADLMQPGTIRAYLRQLEWVFPPYFQRRAVYRVAENARQAVDPLAQLDAELAVLYDAEYLSAMLVHRYRVVVDVCEFSTQIGQSFEAAALGNWASAISTLLPAIEGIMRAAAPRKGFAAGQGTSWLPTAIASMMGSKKIENAIPLLPQDGYPTGTDAVIAAKQSDAERDAMLEGFRSYAAAFLYENTQRYSGQTRLNRHGILHGVYNSGHDTPGNFYRLVTLLDILCFVFTFDMSGVSVMCPEDSAESLRLAAYYRMLGALAKVRP